MRRRNVWWLLCFPLLWVGCQCDEEGVSGGRRRMVVSPTTLVFDVTTGQKQRLASKVKIAQGPVRVESVKLVEGAGTFTMSLSTDGFPKVLETGEEFRIEVDYKGQQGVAPTGKIKILSDATEPRDGEATINLLAQVNRPELVFEPSPVDFHSVAEGQEKTLVVKGKNVGRGILKISKIRKDPASSPGFRFPEGLPQAPIELGPGKEFSFKVTYKPTPRRPDVGQVAFFCEGGCTVQEADPSKPTMLRFQGMMSMPAIEVTPKLLDFGAVATGTTKSKTFKITNQGQAPLKISTIAFKSGSSGAFIMPMLTAVEIGAGQSREVGVQYQPAHAPKDEGVIEIKSNDPDHPLVALPVMGRTMAPDIEVTPKKLSFGKVPATKTLGVTVSNVGAAPLILQSVALDPGSSPEFTLAQPPKTPLTLQPNRFSSIGVVYKPTGKTPAKGKLIFKSNDPDEREVTVLLEGKGTADMECDLIATPSSVNFGLSIIGRNKVISVTFGNQGAKVCNVKGISVTTNKMQGFPPYIGPDVFHLPRPPSTPMVVQPGQSFKLDVAFHPTQEWVSALTGSLDVVTDATTRPVRSVPLSGLGSTSCVEVVPDNLDFGLVTVGCSSRDEPLIIYNTCKYVVTVQKLSLVKGNTGFRIVRAQMTPFQIQPGQSAEVKLAFRASAVGPRSDVFQIEHSIKQQSPISIPLRGKGTTDSQQTDTFKQLKQPKVDILFVLDDSGSMGEEQRSLATNISSFINWATKLKVDYQIGIITTDVDGDALTGKKNPDAGKLIGSPKIITNATPNAVKAFQNNAKVGTGGSGTEKGLAAAQMALSPPLITDPKANKGFLRKDASLSLITISDEDDFSAQPIQFYVNFFKNIKGFRNVDMFRYSAVVGDDKVITSGGKRTRGCKGPGGSATAGKRYIAVAKQCRGVIASICSSNWSNTLSTLGSVTFGYRTQFFLSRPADSQTIVVKVDGKEVKTSATTWKYDANSNSINFEKSARPGPGSTITVTYKAVCY